MSVAALSFHITQARLYCVLRQIARRGKAINMASTSDRETDTRIDPVFERHKERLRRTVRLRLDRRLYGVVDLTSILEAVRREALRRQNELAESSTGDPFLWLRQITGEVLTSLHRERLGQDIRGDISLYQGALPETKSVSLAANLLGHGGGPDDQAADRAEQKLLLQEALNAMAPIDREVLTLRHCEKLSNDETAAVLAISRSLASESYIRALKRIASILTSVPGFKPKP
jgi:RNA polymerase sigma-70 factor, ECF subfamily